MSSKCRRPLGDRQAREIIHSATESGGLQEGWRRRSHGQRSATSATSFGSSFDGGKVSPLRARPPEAGHSVVTHSYGTGAQRPSNIEISHIEGVLFDKFAARLDGIAHENGENLIRFDGILDANLNEGAPFRIHRRFP